MDRNGNTAMKVIIVLGVLVFAGLFLASLGLRRSLKPNERERVVLRFKQSPFDCERAYKDLETVVSFGPRPAGSESAGELRTFLKKELAALGFRPIEQAFDAETPLGTRRMVNLVAKVEGTRPGVILLGNHYDTKYLPDIKFVGANDGGSTTAWMLEMARVLGPKREGRSVWLVWFDGEESVGPWTETDSLYGSRHMVEELKKSNQLGEIDAMINVDMIGDTYLNISGDPSAPKWLSGIVWDTALRQGYRNHFSRLKRDIKDDHLPFRQAGIPSLLLIDFSYGGSLLLHQQNWHTAQDTIDRVSAESLQAVADVLYDALPAIDAYLGVSGRG